MTTTIGLVPDASLPTRVVWAAEVALAELDYERFDVEVTSPDEELLEILVRVRVDEHADDCSITVAIA